MDSGKKARRPDFDLENEEHEEQKMTEASSKANKRRALDTKDEDQDWEDDSSDDELNFSKPKKKAPKASENEMDEEQIDVDFEFYDPQEAHFFSVKTFLNSYLDGMSFKSSELAEIIISQPEVGTLVGVADDPEEMGAPQKSKDVLGFASLLNVKQYEKKAVIGEILKFASGKSAKHNEDHEKFLSIVTSRRVGLYINERIINLDPHLIPTLHAQILEDLKWVQEENIETKDYFELDYVLYLTKIHKEINKSKQKKLKSQDQGLKEYIYPKFEDFHLLQNCENHFLFEAKTTKNNAGLTNLEKDYSEEQCLRAVLLVDFKTFKKCLNELNQFLE